MSCRSAEFRAVLLDLLHLEADLPTTLQSPRIPGTVPILRGAHSDLAVSSVCSLEGCGVEANPHSFLDFLQGDLSRWYILGSDAPVEEHLTSKMIEPLFSSWHLSFNTQFREVRGLHPPFRFLLHDPQGLSQVAKVDVGLRCR